MGSNIVTAQNYGENVAKNRKHTYLEEASLPLLPPKIPH
jgi:hypothetical protein